MIDLLTGLLGGGGGAAAGGSGGALGGILSGAAMGGPVGALIGAAPAIAKFFTGRAQKRKAAKINPIDPGFQANSGILDNQRLVTDRFNNYTLPGKSQILNNLDRNMAGAMSTITQGASSSGDILDAVTKLSSNQDDAVANLGIQEAMNKDAMFGQVLDANVAAGSELVRKNQYDQQKYQEKLQEKAALNNAAAQNKFSAFDSLSKAAGTMLNYKSQPTASSVPNIDVGGSIFGSPAAPSININGTGTGFNYVKPKNLYDLKRIANG